VAGNQEIAIPRDCKQKRLENKETKTEGGGEKKGNTKQKLELVLVAKRAEAGRGD
jgi:hypothetical protein